MYCTYMWPSFLKQFSTYHTPKKYNFSARQKNSGNKWFSRDFKSFSSSMHACTGETHVLAFLLCGHP